jgi:hypothetical protein
VDASGTSYDFDFLSPSEQDLTGWTIEHVAGGANIIWYAYFEGINAQSGTYFISSAYNGNQMRLWQTFDTVIGQEYQVSFYMHRAQHPYTNYASACPAAENKKLLFTIKENNGSGTTLATFDGDEPNYSWNQHSFNFTATTSQTYLSFGGKVNPCGHVHFPFIDNITVEEVVPPPYPNWQRYGALYPDDPTHANTKSVPGQDIVIDWSAVNTGNGTSDAGTYKMTISIPIQMSFRIGSVVCEQGRRTLKYDEPGLTGLWQASENFTTIDMANTTMTLPCTSSDISYSSVGKNGPWGYIPSMDFSAGASWDGSGGTYWYDNDVRAIRIMPQGEFGHNNGVAPYPAFRAHLVAKIK